MIVNASQCASIFDETYHALRYSALAKKVYLKTRHNPYYPKLHSNLILTHLP